jgi:sepiapterin reductase
MSIAVLITGASRGLGRAIAKVVSEEFDHVRLVLVARSEEGLKETTKMLSSSSEAICRSVDLGDLDSLDDHVDALLEELKGHDRVIFFNNAGSIGHLGPCSDTPSLQDLRDNVDLNVTSCFWLSVRLSKYFQDSESNLTIVNISSLAAVANLPTMGIYSAGKVARDKYHALIANEEKDKIKTLNYAPGPLETEMVEEIRAAQHLDSALKPNFENKVLEPEQSAKKLIRLLSTNSFESGAHIDFYDLPEEA